MYSKIAERASACGEATVIDELVFQAAPEQLDEDVCRSISLGGSWRRADRGLRAFAGRWRSQTECRDPSARSRLSLNDVELWHLQRLDCELCIEALAHDATNDAPGVNVEQRDDG